MVRVLLFALTLSASLFGATPTNMTGFFRSGQVFLTWDEVTNGQNYIIYRSTAPITAGDLTTANKRYEVAPNSSFNRVLAHLATNADRSDMQLLTPPCSVSRNVVVPLDTSLTGNVTEIPAGTGVAVFTTHVAGTYYYAVTAVVGGVEDKSIGAGNAIGAITETVQDAAPVLLYQSGIKCARLYLLYTDVDSFNPTYSGTYAWPFWVGVKQNYATTSDKVDLRLTIEGMDGTIRYTQNYAAWNSDGIEVKACETGSWWFGYSQTYQFDTSKYAPTGSSPISDQGPVVNFVQARIMNFLKWMIQVEPYYANRIDTNQIYVAGGSMGGGGTLLFLQYYPDFFAYGDGKVPPTNFLETTWTWLRQCEARWGSHTNDDIKVHFTGWRSERLEQAYGGMILHQFLNVEQMVLSMEGMELPWITFCSGGKDGSVTWPQQGRNYYTNLNASRRGWNGGCQGASGHDCGGLVSGQPQLSTIHKNNSFLAFSNVSGNPALPLPDVTDSIFYIFNKHLIWSTPYYKVGNYQNQVDQINRYEIVIASLTGDNTADITPRKLQQFVVTEGADYIVKNTAVNDTNTVFQIDTITADSFNLITFRNFQIKSGDQNTGGSRFIMVPVDPVSEVAAQSLKTNDMCITVSPNPFNPTTEIKITNYESQIINELKVFNLKGELVKDFSPHVRNSKSVVRNSILWDASNQPSGVYIIKARLGNRQLVNKIVLTR